MINIQINTRVLVIAYEEIFWFLCLGTLGECLQRTSFIRAFKKI